MSFYHLKIKTLRRLTLYRQRDDTATSNDNIDEVYPTNCGL